MLKASQGKLESKRPLMNLKQFLCLMPELRKPARIIVCIALLLCSSISSSLIPKMMGRLIDSQQEPTRLQHELYVFLAVVAFNFAALASREYSARLLSEKILKEMRVRVFRSFLEADMEFFDNHGSGDLLSKLSNDVGMAENCVTQNMSEGLSNVLLYLSNMVMLVQVSLRMTLVVMIGLPLFVIVTSIFTKINKQISKRLNKVLAKSQNFMEERFSNILTIAAFQRQEAEIAAMEQFTEQSIELSKKRALYHGIYRSLNIAIPNLYIIGAILVGIKLLEDGVSQGQLTTYLLLSQELSSNSVSIAKAAATLTSSLGSLTKLFELLNYIPRIMLNRGDQLSLPDKVFDIEFKNLNFHYPKSSTLILRNIELKILSGEFIAVVGTSGSGKSSLLKILLRMYDPTQGQVLLNDIDIRQYSISSYHQIIGYVSQDPILFSGSIRDNILYGKPDATQEELEWAIRMAGLNFIKNLRKGLQTKIGQRGTKLSGGQKQRLSIARALIRRPKILIFDEATSALDSENEQLIQRSIEHIIQETKKNRLKMTVIVIAHRLATVRAADRIVVVEGGCVSLQETHSYIMQHHSTDKQMRRNKRKQHRRSRQMIPDDDSLREQDQLSKSTEGQ